MLKKSLIAIFILFALFNLVSCKCKHEWKEATCTEPMTCSLCGEKQGEPLGHKWAEATCTEPMTCSVCGEKQGEPLGHKYVNPTCSSNEISYPYCDSCGEILRLIKANEKIVSPSISSDATFIKGGVRYTINNYQSSSVVYYGYVEEDAIWNDSFNFVYSGDEWSIDSLPNCKVSDERKIYLDIKEPGEWRIYAIAVNKDESSEMEGMMPFYPIEQYEGKTDLGEEYGSDFYIRNGLAVYSKYKGEYSVEAWIGTKPDMSDAILIEEGFIPDRLVGISAYIQYRNAYGQTDSEVMRCSIPNYEIEAPGIEVRDGKYGKIVSISIPDVRFDNYAREWGERSVPESEVKVYYTLNGDIPVPGESNLYEGEFVVEEEGDYCIRAIACYRGGQSSVSNAINWDEDPSFTLEKPNNVPNISIEGLSIRVSTGSAVYLSTDGISYEELNGNSVIIDESYVGKTLYFSYKTRGRASVDLGNYIVESLEAFQNKYSKNSTRQFGNWIVKADVNKKGESTGTYSIFGRFPMGTTNSKYMVVALGVSEGNPLVPSLLIFCKPSNGDINNTSATFNQPWSARYSIDGVEYCVEGEVYNLNVYSYSASYIIKATNETDEELFKLLNDTNHFELIFKIEEGLSFVDMLETVSVAMQNSNSNIQEQVIAERMKNLDEYSFIFDNKGLKEALEYYSSQLEQT